MSTPLDDFNGFFWPPLVCILYDHLLTLNLEMRLVWKAPWNTVKGLFLLTRYLSLAIFIFYFGLSQTSWFQLGLIGDPDASSPYPGYRALVLLISLVPPLLADGLLLLRLYAIWKRDARVLIASIAIYISTYAVFITLVTLTVLQSFSAHFSKYIHEYTAYRACILAFDIWALIMTLIKAVQHNRAHLLRTRLFQLFYRDGIVYYTTIMTMKIFAFAIPLCYAAVVHSPDQNNYGLWMPGDIDLLVLTSALSVALTTRMFLNLRDVSNGTDWAVVTNICRGSEEVPLNASLELATYKAEEEVHRHTTP